MLEQYVKLVNLLKEHYRAMLVADLYAAAANSLPFREVPIVNDGVHVPAFSSSSMLQLETTGVEFNPLPKKFHFVMIYCLLLGGEAAQMRATFSSFCAEAEIGQMLRVKAHTGGLTTDKFESCNCTIQTAPSLTPENRKVVVSIGKETMIPFGNYSYGFDDFHNTLFEKGRNKIWSAIG